MNAATTRTRTASAFENILRAELTLLGRDVPPAPAADCTELAPVGAACVGNGRNGCTGFHHTRTVASHPCA